MNKIIPAILEIDINEAQKKIALIDGITELAQIDIMDGGFVEGKTIDITELENIEHTVNLEIHLMVKNPRDYFAACQKLNIYRVLWHYEADSDIDRMIQDARPYSFKKGIVLNPETEVSSITRKCNCLDAVMFMGVNPGKQGQAFIEDTVTCVAQLRAIYRGPIIVDGGVSEHNIKNLVEAGATDLVVGSALFKSEDVVLQYEKLKKLVS